MRIAALTFVLFAATQARAQSFLFRYADNSTPGVGWSLRSIGDVDGDYFPEVAIGSFRLDCGFAGCGAGPSKVVCYSTGSQSVLWEYVPPTFDGSGIALDRIGDVDGDGIADVVSGAPDTGFPFTTGEVRILSGASGALIASFVSPGSPNDDFGMSVAGLGDLDGDVVPDLAAANYNEAFVIASGTGNVLFSTASFVSVPVITVVALYGDYDVDGKSDLLVGQVSGDSTVSGMVRIYSGANGAVLKSFSPATTKPTFGWSVAATPDVDGDGRPEVIVGSPGIDFGTGLEPGVVQVLSSNTGAALRTFTASSAEEHLGMTVAGGRDFDGDAIADIAATATCYPGSTNCARRVVVWSGATGQEVMSAGSNFTGEFGTSVDFIGDFTGNTVSELAFGSPCSEPWSQCGEVRFYEDAAADATPYCTAGTTSNGCVPSMGFIGTPSASAPSGFTLRATSVEGQKQGIFFYGITGQQAQPWASGSTSFLCVKTPTQRMNTLSSAGTLGQCDGLLAQDWNAYMATHPAALGSPRFAGESIDAQAWFRDPPAVKTTNLTNALHFVVMP